MTPFVSILTDIILMVLVAIATACGVDINAHAADLSKVAGEISLAIVLAVSSGGLMLGKWFAHSKFYAQYGPGSLESASQSDTPKFTLLILVAIGLGLMMASCGPSFPVGKQVAGIDIAYSGAADTLSEDVASFTPAQRQAIAQADTAAYRAVKAVDAAGVGGQPVSQALIDAANAAIAELKRQLEAAKVAATKPASTRPQ